MTPPITTITAFETAIIRRDWTPVVAHVSHCTEWVEVNVDMRHEYSESAERMELLRETGLHHVAAVFIVFTIIRCLRRR